MNNKIKKAALSVGAVVFWILVWQVGATLANKKLIVHIPQPADTIRVFFSSCCEAEFWRTAGISLLHIVGGFMLAVAAGIVLGMLCSKSKIFDAFASPILRLIRTVPVAALIIVAWLWIPSGALPSFIAFLMVLPIVCSHTISGLNAVDAKLIEMAKVCSLSDAEIALKIKLPSISPHIREGCITGVGIAWKAGVAAEVIATPSGTLGALLSSAKTAIDYNEVFAVTLAVVLLSVFVENILKVVWRRHRYD